MLPVNGCALAAKRMRDSNSVHRGLYAAVFSATAVLLAGCSTTMKPMEVAPVVAPDPSFVTQSVLRDLITARKAVLGPAVAKTDAVTAFYEIRGFRPVWTLPGQNDVRAQVRATLNNASEQGLRAGEYQLPGEARLTPGRDAALFEMQFTDALLRYAYDVHNGHLKPSDVYEDVELPLSNFDPVVELVKAVRNDGVPKFLAALPPAHPEYARLVQALARYRAIEAKGGWPSIQGPGEVKLEGNDQRLSALVKRLAAEDPVFAAIASPSAADIKDAVKRFQSRNGISEDGRAGGTTLTTLNISAAERAGEIAVNMERWRWMPVFEQRHVAVNVPDQSVEFVRDGRTVLHSPVVVGRTNSPTPITRSEIVAVVVNPPWNIPGDIAARDLLPQLVKNRNYLAQKHMVITDTPKDPYGRKIDWKKVIPAEFPYAIQQLPGPATALGAVMLDSPNDFDVYLHDTPNKKLFDLTTREISNGCIRVQQIFPLASLALTDDASEGMAMLNGKVKARETTRIALDKPLPVYFLYWTAMAKENGEVDFRPDRYNRDAPLIAALVKGQAVTKAKKPVDGADQTNPEGDNISP
ncbi:MAG TPA: L,D-transpeptidase family protein [Micropepsaceae bacterium]|nr:L,D-transpeptidase family protein [Micropepsaceae bacterium]